MGCVSMITGVILISGVGDASGVFSLLKTDDWAAIRECDSPLAAEVLWNRNKTPKKNAIPRVEAIIIFI